MALPGTTAPAPTAATKAPVAVIPFMRAARKKSSALTTLPTTALVAASTALSPTQITAGGYLRRVKITVTGTVPSNNAATVVFAGDGPFSVLDQISLTQPNGTPLVQPISGFDLYVINKYLGVNTGRFDPLADPGYTAVAGAGVTGGNFSFNLSIPIEVDERDALGALANMAANQAYLLQVNLAASASVYSTAPTALPNISIVMTMEYYSAPAAQTANGIPQQTAPTPIGSLNLIQVQTPAITANTSMKTQIVNVGNAMRAVVFILRDASAVRTEVDFPATVNIKFLGDVLFYKTKIQWVADMATNYNYTAGKTAKPTLNSLDNGVFVLMDFMNGGGAGGTRVDGSASRDLLLLTDSASLFEFEALAAYGASASTLKILTQAINASSLEALFHPYIS